MTLAQNLKPIVYRDANQKLNGFITRNAGNNFPGVLILPAWFGIDNEAVNAALALEKQGYTAFIADIFGEGNIPENKEQASKTSMWYKQNFEIYQKRILLAVEALKNGGAIPEKIAVIGICFGGTGALEAARGQLPIAGAVCTHGALAKNPNRKTIFDNIKILVQHPANDHSVSLTDYNNFIAEMKEGNADWQIITYGNSKHTFTNPQSPDYHEKMANRAWTHTLLFLHEILK